jgi:hypothetical protein
VTKSLLRNRILAMLATGGLAGTACGGATEHDEGTGGSATGGNGPAGAGGNSAGGITSFGGSAGAGGTTSFGGSAGLGGAIVTGGASGSGAGGSAGGLVTKGNVDCNGCIPWESCWPKGQVPQYPGTPPNPGCPQSFEVDGSQYPLCNGWAWFSSGPVEDGDTCCYQTQTCVVGRPLVVNGRIRTAPAVLRSDWADEIALSIDSLDNAARALVADAWLEDARLEHASVAAFSRLTLELLALGAPPDLVSEAQTSALDEIEHARICFGIASRFAGRSLGPGALPIGGALDGEISLALLARSTFVEGAVGETVAALVAAAQARAAAQPRLASALERIAEDESRHAAFAWRVVRWALRAGGREVEQALRAAFTELGAEPATATATEETGALRAFGRLDPGEIARIREEALREVVAPCLAALLGEGVAQAVAAA